MKRCLIFLLLLCYAENAAALQLKQHIKTSVGIFDALEQTLTYSFYRDKDYDIKTSMNSVGTFGAIYPFKATYHSVGTYNKGKFQPQDYFYETESRFHKRSKEIVYKNGIPQYRISKKDKRTRKDDITIDENRESSNDILTAFAAIVEQILRKGNCNIEQYSFNGKNYSLIRTKSLGKEKIKTDYFSGRALKCEFYMQNLKKTDAGMIIKDDTPLYFWILYDKDTEAPFLAKAVVESTPLGKLEAITTKIEVKK